MAQIVGDRILAMLVVLLIGMAVSKGKLITERGNKELSNLLLFVVNPLIIFLSFQQDFSTELLKNLGFAFLLSAICYGVMIPLSTLCIRKSRPFCVVERFASIYSNCGFFGIPLVNAVFGQEGVFYLTAYIAMFNILAWTHGVLLMEQGKGIPIKEMGKHMLNINIFASILGFICFFFQIRIGGQLLEGLSFVSDMNTPLAMLIAGITLTYTSFGKVARETGVYLVSALRLLVFPAIMIVIFRFLPLDEMLKQTILIACACPVAANTTLFALRFDREAPYASALYAVTTVLSLATLPLVLNFV